MSLIRQLHVGYVRQLKVRGNQFFDFFTLNSKKYVYRSFIAHCYLKRDRVIPVQINRYLEKEFFLNLPLNHIERTEILAWYPSNKNI